MMANRKCIVEYFYATVPACPGGGHEVLNQLADCGVDLAAMAVVPVGPDVVQLTLFPNDRDTLVAAADKTGLTLTGPQHAILVQGEDQPGALAGLLRSLCDAQVHVFASTGVCSGDGRFGHILYIRPQEIDKACRALGMKSPSESMNGDTGPIPQVTYAR